MASELDQLLKLQKSMEELVETHKNILDLVRLLIESMSRIATGKSPDPRLDACNTLRAAAVFAVDGIEILNRRRN